MSESMKTPVAKHGMTTSVNSLKALLKATLTAKFKNRIERLTRTISRLTSSRNYWRRKSLTPGRDNARKKKWRDSNPEKYAAELLKNSARYDRKKAARNGARVGTNGN